MTRKILLLEPNYKNKYPPIGLMKLATYHRRLKDDVTFYKGDLNKFVLEQVAVECVHQLQNIDSSIFWQEKLTLVASYIKRKNKALLEDADYKKSEYLPLINKSLDYYRMFYLRGKYFEEKKWDRVYVTTLFTFYWKITIDTILFAKKLVKDPINDVKVGGVMASLLPKEILQATDIRPMEGLLDKPFMLDNNPIIIDELPLDYSILDEIDYSYPTKSAYFTFMTKGCTRKCSFCSVPKLEPIYKPKIDTIEKFQCIKDLYGDQQNLLLMDNNVLASPNFPEIIEEIKEMGFYKGATYVEPNQLNIAINNLRAGLNDKAYIRRSYRLINDLLKRLKGQIAQDYYYTLEENNLLNLETTTKENLLKVYLKISDIYERNRNKSPKLRYVDFNQGTDCRYVTDEYMYLMSQIPIRPLRIAFDYLGLKETYIKAIELAEKHGIRELSNYILYNFWDSPEDLYERLHINQELCLKLNLHIYSFPMKYIPLYGEEAKSRDYVGAKWNKKFIRAIQSILNVTKGIVAPARTNDKGNFFERAFGKNINEFKQILYMPEAYIIYRDLFEKELGYTEEWRKLFCSLTDVEWDQVKPIIESNDFANCLNIFDNPKLVQLLQHYTISRDSVEAQDRDYQKLKHKFDNLIKKETYLNLTLTYDFEAV